MSETRPGYCVFHCCETPSGRPLMTDIRREKREGVLIWTCLNCMLPRQIPAISCRPAAKSAGIAAPCSPGRKAGEFRMLLKDGRVPESYWTSFTTDEFGVLLGFEPTEYYSRMQALKCLRSCGAIDRLRRGIYKVRREAIRVQSA